MFKVSSEKLLANTGRQYRLLAIAFQRVHQLNAGMLPTIVMSSKKNVTIALQEIAEGKVRAAPRDKVEDEEESATAK